MSKKDVQAKLYGAIHGGIDDIIKNHLTSVSTHRVGDIGRKGLKTALSKVNIDHPKAPAIKEALLAHMSDLEAFIDNHSGLILRETNSYRKPQITQDINMTIDPVKGDTVKHKPPVWANEADYKELVKYFEPTTFTTVATAEQVAKQKERYEAIKNSPAYKGKNVPTPEPSKVGTKTTITGVYKITDLEALIAGIKRDIAETVSYALETPETLESTKAGLELDKTLLDIAELNKAIGITREGEAYAYKQTNTETGEYSITHGGKPPEPKEGIEQVIIYLDDVLTRDFILWALAGIKRTAPVQRDKDEQLELFSNIKMGVDTAEIIARHQFFNPMYRGLMQMGEQGIYEAVTNANKTNKYEIAIPYETTGYNSVYKASMQLQVNISGVDVSPVKTEADAQRLQARLHKAHNMLSLWAMETNSNNLYNVKMADLLRLAGYKGRITADDYTDVTNGIVALVAQTITRGSDTHYTDPKTGKAIKLGKNELYGEIIRPVGSLGAIWHIGKREYEYTDKEYKRLSDDDKEGLEFRGYKKVYVSKKSPAPQKQDKIGIYNRYKMVKANSKNTQSDLIDGGDQNRRQPTELIKVYDTEPKYIKKIVKAQLAEGMLNPTQERATVLSKSLLQLNTLQERHYLIIGVIIGELYSQYDKKTAEGKPITLTIHTLLEYRGLADPDSLRRVSDTKGKLKDALDKLQQIGHVERWAVKGGKDYADIALDPNGLKTVILIYPPEHVKQVLRPAIADPDSKLTNILRREVREQGINEVATKYGTTAEQVEAIVNNKDTVDSLPSQAYNDLKAQQYDKNQAKGQARKGKK